MPTQVSSLVWVIMLGMLLEAHPLPPPSSFPLQLAKRCVLFALEHYDDLMQVGLWDRCRARDGEGRVGAKGMRWDGYYTWLCTPST